MLPEASSARAKRTAIPRSVWLYIADHWHTEAGQPADAEAGIQSSNNLLVYLRSMPVTALHLRLEGMVRPAYQAQDMSKLQV